MRQALPQQGRRVQDQVPVLDPALLVGMQLPIRRCSLKTRNPQTPEQKGSGGRGFGLALEHSPASRRLAFILSTKIFFKRQKEGKKGKEYRKLAV